MKHINFRLKILYIIATVALAICLVFAGVYIGVVDKGFTPFVNGLKIAFDVSGWHLFTHWLDTLAAVMSFLFVVLGGIMFIIWILVSLLAKKRKWGLYGALLHGIFCTLASFFCASLIGVNSFEVLGLITYIVVILTQFIILCVFVVSLQHLFYYEEEPQTVVQGVTNTGDTVIINNYYNDEEVVETTEEPKDYVEEDEGNLDVVVEDIVVVDNNGHVEEVIYVDKYQRKPFVQQLAESEQCVRDTYNELKADFLSYGIKSRISRGGDTFRLHTKAYARIKVAGKGLKVYYALDPNDYAEGTFPIKDSGDQKLYVDIPLTFKVKSALSIRRAKQLFAEAAAIDGITEQEDIELATYDWASDAILNHYNDDDDGSGEDIN